MPLDGHSYLVAQGWSGKGTGLRQGAILRPITISQKKTLAGLGKDRDEAFPFWDHLFSAASKSIQVKISNNDSDSDDSDTNTTTAAPTLKRTGTGILSNRRPNDVTPASTSGASTPVTPPTEGPKLSLIALAKREAAKRNLYSSFYRGPVIGPDTEPEPYTSWSMAAEESKDQTQEPQSKKTRKEEDLEKAEKRERKRWKKELKELEKLEKKANKKGTKLNKSKEEPPECEERRRRKEEKRKRREEKAARATKVEASTLENSSKPETKERKDTEDRADEPRNKSKKRKPRDAQETLDRDTTFPKAKKKRKADD